jgi:hypothetical protein
MSSVTTGPDWGLEFTRPELGQVKLPYDITLLSSEQLAQKFAELTAWADYIASELVTAQTDEDTAERTYKLAFDRLLVEKMGTRTTGDRITLIRAQVNIDPHIQNAGQVLAEKTAYRKMVQMLLDNHQRDITLVSREITRRSNDQQLSRKGWMNL